MGAQRNLVRDAKRRERHAIASGDWGPWRMDELPHGVPGAKATGWLCEIRRAYANDLYAVLVRPLALPQGTIFHLAIRTISSLEPPWRDKQRIKNELFGKEATAVEVMPPEAELVDEAPMYHIWVLAEALPFSLHDDRHKRRAA